MKVHRYAFALSVLLGSSAFAANLAIIDSGVDYKHKDLASVMWSNPEKGTTTKDQEYKDDLHGWNFAEKNNQIIDYKYLGTFSADCTKVFEVQAKILQGTATQEEKDWYKAKKADATFLKELQKFGNFVHGTHVSGISSKDAPKAALQGMKLIPTETPGQIMATWLAAHPNAGADSPIAKLMLGFLAKQQAKLLIQVGNYTAAVKSEVANGSFGVSVASVAPVLKGLLKQFIGHEPTEQETREYAIYFVEQIVKEMKGFPAASPETLFVFAAGNDGTDNDSIPTAPANIKLDNTIAVAATMGTASLASFSNYGSKMVEVAAPGVAIVSTIPGDAHMALSGTSMAAPFVTNVAGLVKDKNPEFKAAEIKRVLIETVDKKDFLSGKVSSGGIVNLKRAVFVAELVRGGMKLDTAIAQSRSQVADMQGDAFNGVNSADLLVLPLPSPF